MRRLALSALPAILLHAFLLLWAGPQGGGLVPPVERLKPLRIQLAVPALPPVTPGVRPFRKGPHYERPPKTAASPPLQPPATSVREKIVSHASENISVPKDHEKKTIIPKETPARAKSFETPVKTPPERTQKKTKASANLKSTGSRGPDNDAAPLSAAQNTRAIPPAHSAEATQTISPSATGAAPRVFLAQPLYKRNPPPEYPRKARRRGYQGVVDLAVLVDVDGQVKDLKVAASSGYDLLDRAAVRSVQKWLFQPGSQNGNKIEMWVEVPIRFAFK